MKNRLKYISILVCSSLFLTMNVFALSEKQNLSVNNTSFDDINIVEMINSVNESKVLYYYQNLMKFGVRYTGTSNCTLAGDWIYTEFEKMG